MTGEPFNFKPIALTSVVGKLFHQILSESKFVVGNGFIDPKIQKAFLRGLSGCPDHNLNEIINHAKLKNRTVHITWFDLEDAFGSVSHDLIPVCLDRMHIPPNVRDYIVALYRNLRGKVWTANLETDEFAFNKCVVLSLYLLLTILT